MKIKELIIELLKVDNQQREVCISSDPEGNSKRTCEGFYTGACRNIDEYDLEIGLEELTPELKEERYTEEDVVVDGTPCIVLW